MLQMNIFQVFSTCGLFIFFINSVVKWTLNSIDRLSDKGNLIRHMFADGRKIHRYMIDDE